MSRSGRRPMTLGPGLISIVALLVMATCLRSPGDEPTSKDAEKKAPDLKKIEAAAKHKDAALKAAETYLILVDKAKYAEGWEKHTSNLSNLIPREKWVDALNKTRLPFGRLQRRKLLQMDMRATEDPEKIDQAWILSDLEFQSGFHRGELVVVYFERAKEWKVSHYYIGDPETFPKPPEVEKETKTDEDPEPKPAQKIEKKKTKPTKKSADPGR